MHVVTAKGNPDAESIVQGLAFVGLSIAISIGQFPQLRDAGVEELSTNRQKSRTGSLFNRIEAVGKHGRLVRAAVAIGVLKQTNPVVLERVLLDVVLQVFLEIGDAIFD